MGEETVVHDPQGRPWLVATADLSLADPVDGRAQIGFETQVYYTARAGIRGVPTGHGERYTDKAEAVAGHRRWCLCIRHGEVYPDLPPESAV
jgi:hypothetical protein